MAYPAMSPADIAEILDEAATARRLAAAFKDRATVEDLLAYAAALEADAAEELAASELPGRGH
jgi:hypothetical protein